VPSERQVFNTQIEGDHAIGTKNSKLTWNLNYANLAADQNDLRTAFYSRTTTFDANDEPISETSSPYKIVDRNSRRYFGGQVDHNMGAGANYAMPFQAFGQKQTLKAGYMGLYKTRTFAARIFQYEPQTVLDDNIAMQPVDQIFSANNMGIPGGFRLNEITNPTDKYDASGLLNAGYAMMDNNLGDKWRLTWGVRFESYLQTLQAVDMSGAKIDKQDVFNDVLPSFNLSYNMSGKSKFRFGASRTVNRPEFREIAPFQFIDFENLWQITGNPNLVRSNITNVDLRYEYYPNPGEAITAGVFYKGFQNPIEIVMDPQTNLDLFIFGYQNAKSATSVGAEIDVRKNLSFIGAANWLENITLGGNFTYVYSKVDATGLSGGGADRPLQGQSPYLVNLSVLYSDSKSGLGVSALYNRIGQRIAIVGNNTTPNTWENGRDVIDLQLSKSLLKNRAEVKLTVADILNQPTTFYWNTDGKNTYTGGSSKVGDGNDQIFQQFRMGTTFTLGFNYRLGK
jgi:TonB-dependent receptor